MNNAILTDEEKEIFKKLVRPEIVVNISRYYLLDSVRILIRYKDKSFMDIPAIKCGINKCSGMKKDKNYTLREEIAPDGFVRATLIIFEIDVYE